VSITVFFACIAIIITLGIFATNRVSQESEFRGTTGQQLKTIEQHLSSIDTAILALRVGQAANGPTNKKNVADAKQILESAIKNAIRLPANVVEQSGKDFIGAASKEPAAWDAALRFVEYRSYLNTFNQSVIPSGPRNTNTQYTITSPLGYPPPSLSVVGLVRADQAARLNRIGQGLQTDTEYGNAFIVQVGSGVILDGYELRNVVFQNVHVVYQGGPIQMKNVYFIGCTFDFVSDTHGKEMAAAILSSPAINLAFS